MRVVHDSEMEWVPPEIRPLYQGVSTGYLSSAFFSGYILKMLFVKGFILVAWVVVKFFILIALFRPEFANITYRRI